MLIAVGGLVFLSVKFVFFYGKISNTCSYFAKGSQDVELEMLKPAKKSPAEFLNLEYECFLLVGMHFSVCVCASMCVCTRSPSVC